MCCLRDSGIKDKLRGNRFFSVISNQEEDDEEYDHAGQSFADGRHSKV